MRIKDQSISCDSGCFLVCLAESSVNYNQSSVCLEWIFSLHNVNRGVTINNMRIFRIQSKLPQQHPADRLGILIAVIWILRFLPGTLIA